MFKIAAFDMDGTIADTIPMCIEAFRNSVSPYTDHEPSEEEIVQTFGLNETGMVKAIVKHNWKQALSDFYFQYARLHNKVTERIFWSAKIRIMFLTVFKIYMNI